MYYIGIDGSGSYSRLVAVSDTMKIVGRHAGNIISLGNVSEIVVKENIKRLLFEFNKLTNTKMEDCKSICVGAAGIHTEDDKKIMMDILTELAVTCPIKVVNDAELVLATVTKGQPGVAIVSGQGSIGYAIDKKGKSHRCGGWGYLIDDGGSGYRIGMDAIKYALMSFDGRIAKTELVEKVKDFFGIKDIREAITIIYDSDFEESKILELAMIVKYAAEQKDKIAMEIEAHAAKDLYHLAKTLISSYGLTNSPVVLGGSVLLLNESIRAKVTKMIRSEFEKVEVIILKEKPEMGAVYLAIALSGVQ